MGERTGWIFDAVPEAEGMRVWVIRPGGIREHVLDPWAAPFAVDADPANLRRARGLLGGVRGVEREGADFVSGRARRVLEIRLPPPEHGPAVKCLKRAGVLLYNADIHPVQRYHYERGHFPLAFGVFHVEDGRLRAFELRDDPWALDYPLPPLRFLHIALAGPDLAGPVDPNHAARGGLVLSHEGTTHVLEGGPAEQLDTLIGRLKEWDPDVLTTDWGDSYLIPALKDWARRTGRVLPLSRDGSAAAAGRAARSFYTYGRTVYQSGAIALRGRWHLDMKNSFFLREVGLEGLYEIARMAKIPVQRAARTTIGTSLSSMQMDTALRRGILIPLDKAQAEDFRPAAGLIKADKGGLVYEPDIGWHDRVAEFDFVSMYPALMVRKNISPETVNCGCCPDNVVPEIGHHLCRRRRGLIPEVLAPILEKRSEYKRLAKSDHPHRARFKSRADAHKWCLVTCFGYLGFKNARFGKIEAHECVTAWGRELLLQAKETVEGLGNRLLHANVDCVWVQGPAGADPEAARRAIEAAAGCPVGLEGVYKWIRFCPSKTDPASGVPNRYFGAFENGEIKVRGLALRRRDTPEILKRMQREMLAVLAGAESVDGCRALAPRLAEIADSYRAQIAEGRAAPADLAVAFQLSKDPGEYVHNTLSAVAARRLSESGVRLHAGETVRYLITSARDRIAELRALPLAHAADAVDYDAGKYLELWDRCRREIMDGLPGGSGEPVIPALGRRESDVSFPHGVSGNPARLALKNLWIPDKGVRE